MPKDTTTFWFAQCPTHGKVKAAQKAKPSCCKVSVRYGSVMRLCGSILVCQVPAQPDEYHAFRPVYDASASAKPEAQPSLF